MTDLFLDNYDEEKVRQVLMEDAREEGWEKGRAEGRAEGRLRLLISLIAGKVSAGCTLEQIHKDLGSDITEIDLLYDMVTDAGKQADEDEILRSYLEKEGVR